MKGIDVSEHNGEINWDSAKAGGLDFALIRCGYGQDETSQDDKQFIRNASECERLCIPYGVYLYSYALNVGAIQGEINHMLRLLKGRKLSYPVYIDMEDADNYKANHGGIPSRQVNTDMIKTFCDAMSKAGYQAGYYCNKDWYENYICPEQLTKHSFWFARPGVSAPDIKCDIWQSEFGERGGSWDGVGAADLDISYIDKGSSQSPVPQPNPVNQNATDYYVVQSGDTLSGIASRYGTTYQELAKINNISNPDAIYVGQKIYFKTQQNSAPSTDEGYYTVQSGDTLSGIASRYGMTYQHLAEINGISDPNRIYVGQKLKISGSTAQTSNVSSGNENYYVVQSGDTLSSIASKYGTTYQHLAQINGINDPNRIYIGQKIKVSGSVQQTPQHEYYTVQSGDTLSGIASRYGTSYQHLAGINGISDPNRIYVGQRLLIS